MCAVDTAQTGEAIRLLQFGDCTRVPNEAFPVPVAWPVTAWRVLVPTPRRNGSDPLQRAVLRIISAGCVDPHAISSWLDIPTDLVRVLIGIYRSDGFIDEREQIILSESGKSLLKEDDEITFSDKSHHRAWILRDDWSGDIIPFLIEEDLRWCSSDVRSTFTVLRGERLCTDRPQPLRVREALSKYREYVNQVRNCERTNDAVESVTPRSEKAEGQETGERTIPGIVQLLWERSERVYVPITLFITPDDPQVWQIATGFSLPPLNGWFASKLAWGCSRLPELRQQVEAWIAEVNQLFPQHPTLDESDRRALREFPFLAASPELSDTRGLLARAYRAATLCEHNPENIDVYVTRCYLALEALLTVCISKCHDAVSATRLVREDSFVKQLRDIAKFLELSLPEGFCNPQYAKKVCRAARGRGENLRDRAIALMYCAIHDRRSPARSAFAKDSELLVHLDTITRFRNKWGSHYEPLAQVRDVGAMAAQADKSTRHVVGMLGGGFFESRENVKQTQTIQTV